jgi:hypothetical protein
MNNAKRKAWNIPRFRISVATISTTFTTSQVNETKLSGNLLSVFLGFEQHLKNSMGTG